MKRRTFMTASASVGSALLMNPSGVCGAEAISLSEGDVVLFQGDSITDAGRNKKSPVANEGLGRGYPNAIAKSLTTAHPQLNLQIHNRGISGNKVPDLAKRWDKDCLDLKPKILSILIGVNDMWHMLSGRYNGTAETYRDGFAELLSDTRAALPSTVFVICEPFVLRSGTVKSNEDKWFPEFDTRRRYAKEVAANAEAIWVPFQEMFDDAVSAGTAPGKLAGDGVHPTAKGHLLMAKTWREVVGV